MQIGLSEVLDMIIIFHPAIAVVTSIYVTKRGTYIHTSHYIRSSWVLITIRYSLLVRDALLPPPAAALLVCVFHAELEDVCVVVVVGGGVHSAPGTRSESIGIGAAEVVLEQPFAPSTMLFFRVKLGSPAITKIPLSDGRLLRPVFPAWLTLIWLPFHTG